MDNVILKSGFDFPDDYGRAFVGPKRIKLSGKSDTNLRAKIISFPSAVESNDNKEISSSQDIVEQNSQVAVDVEKKADATPVHSSSVLEHVDLESSNQYAGQSIRCLSSKLIRLTDGMYNKVIKNTLLINQDTAISLENMTSNDSSLDIESKDFEAESSTVDLTSTDIKKAIDVAFDSVQKDTTENVKSVKRAPYPKFKAKVNKYKKMPTNMISDNGLFSSKTEEVTVVTSEADNNTNDRVVPIVAPERKYKFLFTSEKVQDNKEVKDSKFSLDEVSAIADKDEELANLLAQVEERKKAEVDSENKIAEAEEVYNSSVKVLTGAKQRYEASNKALSDAKKKAYDYLHEIEANIADNAQKEQDLRTRAEEQMQEAHMMDEAANKNEAHVEQFNTVLALNSNEVYHKSTAKTYSRNAA